MGKAAAGQLAAGGTDWVKHLLHTDFEHPRRMQLTPAKAYAYIHAQVRTGCRPWTRR